MCACCVHDHNYCRSSATDINQQDRPWGLLMAAKIPFWFSCDITCDITLHATDSLFENTESLHSHLVIFECEWSSILDIAKGIKKHCEIINQLQCYTQYSQSFWKNYLFPQLGVQTWISTIIIFAGPFQTTTPETGSVVTQGASAETHSQNEQQDGAGEVRETKLSKLFMISYYFSCITLFYSWHGAAWAGVWRQTKVALNFSKGTDF